MVLSRLAMLGTRQEPSPTATEAVTRPEPGLARGKWEAPAWAFWIALAVVVLGTGLFVAVRSGMLGRILKRGGRS